MTSPVSGPSQSRTRSTGSWWDRMASATAAVNEVPSAVRAGRDRGGHSDAVPPQAGHDVRPELARTDGVVVEREPHGAAGTQSADPATTRGRSCRCRPVTSRGSAGRAIPGRDAAGGAGERRRPPAGPGRGTASPRPRAARGRVRPCPTAPPSTCARLIVALPSTKHRPTAGLAAGQEPPSEPWGRRWDPSADQAPVRRPRWSPVSGDTAAKGGRTSADPPKRVQMS